MNYKFNEGDRVRITKIDDLDFYCMATLIRWDRLKGTYRMNWWALESWLMLEKPLIKCE